METQEAKDIYKQRGPIAEFSNLWIKVKNGLRQFSVRGIEKVNSEIIWSTLTYNIQIWIRNCWRNKAIGIHKNQVEHHAPLVLAA